MICTSLDQRYHRPARVAVFGATGGIGRALVARFDEDPQVASVFGLARKPPADQGKLRGLAFDLEDEASIAAAVEIMCSDGPLDIVVVATGLLHRAEARQPEKTMAELTPEAMAELFAVNTVGPALIAKHCLPRLRRDSRTVFAALSARVGSIGDNRLGGWLSYRTSKAALNMALTTLAIEQRRRNPDSIVVALHPGTVDTALSQPFSKNVPAGKLFEPRRAAARLLHVVEGLDAGQSGGFFAWDGTDIPW